MQNYYELLGVSRDATPRIVTIACEGKLKALARSGLPDAERQAEEQRIAIEQEKIRHQAEIEKARLLETQQAREQSYDYRRESAQASRAERERRDALIDHARRR